MMKKERLFHLEAPYKPAGDQPKAIKSLVRGVEKNIEWQTLLGVTGSGKTFTLANVIEQLERPALILCHNKTLAAQLYGELRGYYPGAAVEYFVSYYDYYQPEAYLPVTDTYIEKDSDLNEELDRLRLKATSALLSRRDVIVIASVSCIYGLGNPSTFKSSCVEIKKGDKIPVDKLLMDFVSIQYERNDIAFTRGRFRVRGDIVDIVPAYSDRAIRIEFWGNEIETISEIDHLTGHLLSSLDRIIIYPARHFVTEPANLSTAISKIEKELEERLKFFRLHGKLLEAQRIESRTKYDLELLAETGYCPGIENYSRHLTGRLEGQRPSCLIDYFPDDMIVFLDESHRSLPQIRGMYSGDRSRKMTLVEHGFRLPSALDNRPLFLEEFEDIIPFKICMSATPNSYELERSGCIVEQIVRPTGLVDPEIIVRPSTNQIDNLLEETGKAIKCGGRILVTTLTKKMAEELAVFLHDAGISARYVHSEIDALERVSILRDLRLSEFDVLVGVNLLREGLDLPEVTLVAILDADKEGFLRSRTSLIQTAGRAARNMAGTVILYADRITDSMKQAMIETARRRKIQLDYNKKHGITPETIYKSREEILRVTGIADLASSGIEIRETPFELPSDRTEAARMLEKMMLEAADRLEFELAAKLRDKLDEITGTARRKKKH